MSSLLYPEVPDELRYPKFLLERSNVSSGFVFPPSVISAIKIVNAWMNTREKAVHLFIALAREIVDGITEDQLWEVIENFILVPGCDVRVEKHHGALMQLAPVPNSLDKSLQRPIMFFRASFLKYVGDTDSALANRQEFVQIVKILHEYAHMLTC